MTGVQIAVAPLKLSIAIVFETLNHSSLQIPEYLIIIEKAENNYAAYCPDLPGVIVTGPTGTETLELMREAIEFHLEGLKAESLSIPEPTTTAASVDVSV